MTAALAETLKMVAQAAAGAADDWWVIGSAAVALHGGAVSDIKDVDLMMSARDAEGVLRRVGGRRISPDASNRFRSQVFGLWSDPPIPVEVFGGFAVADGRGWRPISFSAREAVVVGGCNIYVPSAAELVHLLHLFGRPKDLQRARSLEA